MNWTFRKRYHFWLVCFATDNGPHSLIVHYPDKLMTPLRLGMLATQEDLAANTPILSVSYLGRMSLETAQTQL